MTVRRVLDRGQLDDLKRRELLSGAIVAAMLIACGDGGQKEPPADQTRRFTDSTGYTSDVPVRLQRIVAVGPPQWGAAQEAKQREGFADVSLERLSEFDGDLMLYGTPQWSFDDNPLFQQLKVVQAGQVVRFPTFTFDGTHHPNYSGCARYMLDQLRAMQPIRADIL